MAITAASYDRLDASAPEFTRHILEQIYIPPITALLAQTASTAPWFGIAARDQQHRWPSWLTVLVMTRMSGAPLPVAATV